ncbi:hypothetical protein ACWIG5_17580 [Streptomyces lydicus]
MRGQRLVQLPPGGAVAVGIVAPARQGLVQELLQQTITTAENASGESTSV